MYEISPEPFRLFESDPLVGDKEEEEDEDTIVHLLEQDMEEDEEYPILRPNLFSRTGSAVGESPTPYKGTWTLQRCVGEHLPSYLLTSKCTFLAKQLIPSFPECIADAHCF